MGSQPQQTPGNPLSIESIVAPPLPQPSSIVKQFTALEEQFYSIHARGLEQDINERKKYAHRIFVMICSWIGAVFLLLIASGIGFHFSLPEAVLLAVIGSTTVNILGIFYIVTHYL